MRNDLHQISFDRKSTYDSDNGHWKQLRRRGNLDWDDLPRKERMRERVVYGRDKWAKAAPLQGWLRRQVGRRWDDVYSEFCRAYDRRSYVQREIHQVLERNVYLHVYEGEDDQLWAHGYCGPRPIYDGDWYVDSEGYLREAEIPPRTRKPKPVEVVPKDDTHEYRLMKGIWYLVRFEWISVTADYMLPSWYEVLDSKYTYGRLRWRWGRLSQQRYTNAYKVVRHKKHLNRKELRKLGLKNGG